MSGVRSIIRLMRPHHYTKNLFVFLPLFFGGQFHHTGLLLKASWAFLAFCLVSSSVYIFNDVMDRKEDRLHPENRKRPVAAGEIGILQASALDLVLTAGALVIAFMVHRDVLLVILGYKLLNVLYSSGLKRIPIFDMMILAAGFVLRLYAGSLSTGIALTEWIIIMTFLLAMLITLGKRRNDVLVMEHEGVVLRSSVKQYNSRFLNYSMLVLSSVIIVAYILYCLDPETVRRVDQNLYVTSVWVVAGILRYLQLLFVAERNLNPVVLLFRDHPLKIILLAWILNFLYYLYIS